MVVLLIPARSAGFAACTPGVQRKMWVTISPSGEGSHFEGDSISPLLTANAECQLPTAYCLLPTANCQLPTAN